MSLFLGKIHFWLYNKILWAEKAEEEIIKWAKKQNLPVENWVQQNIERYGAPLGNKPLEEVIDTSNIHGWLQERIEGAELRQAALVTAILEENQSFKEDLVDIFKRQGEAAAKEQRAIPGLPEEIFNALFDFVLEGMPCDRVNEVVSSDENEFVWETTTCLHKPYWEQVKGDVRNFYALRDVWVSAFVNTLNPAFSYQRTEDKKNKIVRK